MNIHMKWKWNNIFKWLTSTEYQESCIEIFCVLCKWLMWFYLARTSGVLSSSNLHLYNKLCIAVVVFYVIDLILSCQTLWACMKFSCSCFQLVDFGTYFLSALVCLHCVAHTHLHTYTYTTELCGNENTGTFMQFVCVPPTHTCFFFTVNEVY